MKVTEVRTARFLCVVAVALSEPGEAGADSVFLFVLLFSVASRREIS